jgi:hypothetical protein
MRAYVRYFTCLTAIALTACASVSPIQTMAAKDAVKLGYDQYFNTPNYAFSATSRINELQIDFPHHSSKAAPSSQNSFNSIFSRLAKRMSFDMTGVIDRTRQQYQLIPITEYKAKNLQVKLAFPMVYDGQQKAFFVDVSAFDGLLGKAENEGKYSRFDLSRFDTQNKGDELIKIIQKSTLSKLDNVQDSNFVELPLTSDDKRMNVVRKIQVTVNLKDASAQSSSLLKDIVELIRPKKAEQSTEETTEMETEIKEMTDQTNELLDPKSEQVNVLSFDQAGHIIQSDSTVHVTLKKPVGDSAKNLASGAVNISGLTRFNMLDIGKAQLVEPPNADNTVDGLDNVKGSFAGKALASFLGRDNKSDEHTSEEVTDAELEVDHPPKKTSKHRKRR